MIEIFKPIMRADTGRRCVGLAEFKLWREGEMVNVDITYKRKDGSRIYPNPFQIPRSIVLRMPTQWQKGVKLYIVPIDLMHEVIRQ